MSATFKSDENWLVISNTGWSVWLIKVLHPCQTCAKIAEDSIVASGGLRNFQIVYGCIQKLTIGYANKWKRNKIAILASEINIPHKSYPCKNCRLCVATSVEGHKAPRKSLQIIPYRGAQVSACLKTMAVVSLASRNVWLITVDGSCSELDDFGSEETNSSVSFGWLHWFREFGNWHSQMKMS